MYTVSRVITSESIVRPRSKGTRCREPEVRGRRAALDALRRGRPDPAPLYPGSRPPLRDRQGRAALEVALRRPAGTLLQAAAGALPGPQRPADGHERGDAARPSAAARARRGARRRVARLRRGRAAVRRRRARTAASTTCWPTSSRCSTPIPRARRTRTRSRSGSSCCSPPASRRSSPPAPAAGRRSTWSASRAPRAASSARPARRARSRSARRRTTSSSARSAGRWPMRRTRRRARWRRRSGRSWRRSSTTRTCACARSGCQVCNRHTAARADVHVQTWHRVVHRNCAFAPARPRGASEWEA